jgi:hypothetical protein
MSKSENGVVVDLLKTNEFTEEHLATTIEIYETHWKKFYPELYGDKLPDAIEFVGFELVPSDNINLGHQINRVGGKTKRAKYLEIKQNIERNGYKLKYPPISWFRWNDNIDGTVVITGDTRGQILADTPFQIKNRIVAVYKRAAGFTDEQVQDAIDSCGLRFNAIHDPAAPLSTADVKGTVNRAIKRYKDTDGSAGVAPTIDAITERVDFVCGEGIFQPATRLNLIYEIYNNFNPHDVVISWSDAATAKYRLSSFLKRNKFVDTDSVRYIWTSFELYSKAFTRACKVAAESPNVEVRIIVHTATLKGFDLNNTFNSRVQKFVSEFTNIRTSVIRASDVVGTSFDRIKIYGAVPSLGAVHDIDVPFILNERTGKFYQKTNDYTFDATGDEESDLSEFFEEAA